MLRRLPLAVGLALGFLALWLGQVQGKDALEAWQLSARYTARVGAPLLLIIFTASSLARLWPSKLTGLILRQRRWWGLGLAASHTVHLYAFVQYYNALGRSVSSLTALFGGGAYVALYVMAATSFDAAQRELGEIWHRLHKIGIYWLWAIFTISYTGRVVTGRELAFSLPFALLLWAALGLRYWAWRAVQRAEEEKRRNRSSRRKRSSHREPTL